jgi:hypothetical protein
MHGTHNVKLISYFVDFPKSHTVIKIRLGCEECGLNFECFVFILSLVILNELSISVVFLSCLRKLLELCPAIGLGLLFPLCFALNNVTIRLFMDLINCYISENDGKKRGKRVLCIAGD